MFQSGEAVTLNDPWTDEKEEKLYRELARDYPILTSPTRLEKVAQDFVDHFHQRWKVVDTGGGKAMMVCLDKITCVKMHDLVKAKWHEKAAQLEASVAAEEALFIAKGKALPKLLQQRREQVEWMKATECCVVVSQEQGEVSEFAKWRTSEPGLNSTSIVTAAPPKTWHVTPPRCTLRRSLTKQDGDQRHSKLMSPAN